MVQKFHTENHFRVRCNCCWLCGQQWTEYNISGWYHSVWFGAIALAIVAHEIIEEEWIGAIFHFKKQIASIKLIIIIIIIIIQQFERFAKRKKTTTTQNQGEKIISIMSIVYLTECPNETSYLFSTILRINPFCKTVNQI